MTSHKICNAKGFTLIEIIVVLTLFSILGALMLGIGVDSVERTIVGEKRTMVVELLERARTRSMSNIGALPHGVYVTGADITLFQGGTYVPGNPSNEISTSNEQVTITAPATPFSVVFTQLSGTTTPVAITFSNNGQSYSVTVNAEGRIDW
jgi:prepilin-type N-terminal cleavage/methylation domain-containing protein